MTSNDLTRVAAAKLTNRATDTKVVTNTIRSMADENLARQSQAGDLAAFEELVCRYENRIYAFIFQTCRRHTDAREATQDTFVKAFQALNRFDPARPFASWLFSIARRKAIDVLRAPVPSDAGETPEAIHEEDPSELLARREEADGLWNGLRQRLTRDQFQALWLRYAEDMDVARIAMVLGKSKTHVKVLLFR